VNVAIRNPLAAIGERIAERRTARGLAGAELIRRMNLTRFRPRIKAHSHISNIESGGGMKLPSVPALAAMAEVLGTSTDYLVGLSDNPAPSQESAHRVAVNAASEEERALLQELFELISGRSREDQQFLAAVVRRLIAAPAPKPPIVVGDDRTAPDKRRR
jgi:transcriptional regulator with XRE-family HTH domain